MRYILKIRALGGGLWDLIRQEGFKFNLKVGTVNLIERVESGLLSYGNDMTNKRYAL